jgi:hypothetical protein
MPMHRKRSGEPVAKSEQERLAEDDRIARAFLEFAKARAERMQITYEEALAGTIFVLLVDSIQARRIGDRTYVGEIDHRMGWLRDG